MRPVVRTVQIDAPSRGVWEVMADVEGWPTWASSMKELKRQASDPLGVGSRVRVTPQGMPGAVWTVTEYDPPRSFTWTTRMMPGLGLVGGHDVEAHDAMTVATRSLTASGSLGTMLAPLLRRVFRRNTMLATEGLKRHCEARS